MDKMRQNFTEKNITEKDLKKTEHKKSPNGRMLKEKKFEIRNSILIDLFDKVPHIVVIQNMFIATMICLFMSIVINDYLKTGEVTLGMSLIPQAFGKFHITAIVWCSYLTVAVLVFHIFKFWAIVRLKSIPNRKIIKIWDTAWSVLLIILYVILFRTSAGIVVTFNLPVASSAVVLLEQIRFTMKIHAFIRSNAEKVVNFKPHSDQIYICPNFKHYLYFLFAPTTIYRDEYPRTATINWEFVILRFGEVIGVLLYQSFIFHRFILPSYKDFGLRKYTWTEVIAPAVAENSIPGMLILVSGFYQLLHSVQNLFAELLTFGDRQFYTDWWVSTSLADFFRNWNVVVHDWLYTYIYHDIYALTGNKSAGKLAVFVISAIVHEWVLTYMFGFFYPVLIICFMGAAILSIIKFPRTRFVNIMFWYCICFGSGLICSMYTLEYYARLNKPDEDMNTFKYYFIPRWYVCDCIV